MLKEEKMKAYLRYGTLALVTLLILSLMFMAVFESEASANPRGPWRSRGCGKAPPTVVGQTETLSMTFDGLNRTYNVHLPPSYDRNTPQSLVLVFHGYGGSAEGVEKETTLMSPHADANGYIVVYPQSTTFPGGNWGDVSSWNDLSCSSSPGPDGPTCSAHAFVYPFPESCGPSECNWCNCVDDVGFVNAMLDEIEGAYCIDLKRVYATGFSNGGMFVQRLGCDLADRFAAIAPVHGQLAIGFNCAPDTRLSIMNVWGTQDNTLPGDGAVSSDGYYYTSVADVQALWASSSSQNCDANTTLYSTVADGTRNWTCVQRANCATGAEVVECSWRAGHWWPKTPQSSFGNDAIWEFLSKHNK
jgi:polyhydroxybutyrate depolymerase